MRFYLSKLIVHDCTPKKSRKLLSIYTIMQGSKVPRQKRSRILSSVDEEKQIRDIFSYKIIRRFLT